MQQPALINDTTHLIQLVSKNRFLHTGQTVDHMHGLYIQFFERHGLLLYLRLLEMDYFFFYDALCPVRCESWSQNDFQRISHFEFLPFRERSFGYINVLLSETLSAMLFPSLSARSRSPERALLRGPRKLLRRVLRESACRRGLLCLSH